MTAFPSGSGNHIPTDNLNQSTDKPKDAREDLLELVQRVNTIIDSFNANSGICGLTSGGKVDSAKLIGQVDTAQLVADAVDGTKIADDSINSEHIVDGSVDKAHTSFISQATIDNTATNDVVPTQLAVKSFVDSELAGQGVTLSNASGSTASGTTSSAGFLYFEVRTAYHSYRTGNTQIGGAMFITVGQTDYKLMVPSVPSIGTTQIGNGITIPVDSGTSWSSSHYNFNNNFPISRIYRFFSIS
jgi:hypothetical protein